MIEITDQFSPTSNDEGLVRMLEASFTTHSKIVRGKGVDVPRVKAFRSWLLLLVLLTHTGTLGVPSQGDGTRQNGDTSCPSFRATTLLFCARDRADAANRVGRIFCSGSNILEVIMIFMHCSSSR